MPSLRRPAFHSYRERQPEDDDRQSDSGLRKRDSDSSHAERARDCHDAHEAQRHEPQSSAAKLSREQADRDHHQNMVASGKWMDKSVHQPACVALSGVGKCNGRSKYEGGGESR